jgi:hypothetical protein
MNFSRFARTAVLLLGMALVGRAQTAAAQSAEPIGTSGSTATAQGVVATIDVGRLPISLQNIERRFRQGQIREEHHGLNLRYFVDVFAKAPNIVLFTKEDNLQCGLVPGSTPTHRDMIEQMTPREYRNHGGVNVLDRSPSKKKEAPCTF